MGRSSRGSWLGVTPVVFFLACASGGGSTEEPAAAVGTDLAVIEIQHNLTNTSTTLTIMIEPQAGGVRSNLGVVDAGQTRRFTYNAIPGNYRLLAQGSVSSNNFRLSNRDIASWDMQLNNVRVRAK